MQIDPYRPYQLFSRTTKEESGSSSHALSLRMDVASNRGFIAPTRDDRKFSSAWLGAPWACVKSAELKPGLYKSKRRASSLKG